MMGGSEHNHLRNTPQKKRLFFISPLDNNLIHVVAITALRLATSRQHFVTRPWRGVFIGIRKAEPGVVDVSGRIHRPVVHQIPDAANHLKGEVTVVILVLHFFLGGGERPCGFFFRDRKDCNPPQKKAKKNVERVTERGERVNGVDVNERYEILDDLFWWW